MKKLCVLIIGMLLITGCGKSRVIIPPPHPGPHGSPFIGHPGQQLQRQCNSTYTVNPTNANTVYNVGRLFRVLL